MAAKVTGVELVRKNIGNLKVQIDKNTEKTLTAIMMTARTAVMLKTPVDTSTLINSIDYQVSARSAVLYFRAGFSDKTGFNYALKLEENENWTPRKKPNAGPHFMRDGFESPEAKSDIWSVIKASNNL